MDSPLDGTQLLDSPNLTSSSADTRQMACEECGLVVDLPALQAGQKARCPRCHHTLLTQPLHPYQRVPAYAITSLIMLILSVSFPFMSFSVKGLTQEITLFHSLQVLDKFQNTLLALLLLGTVVVLPTLYILLLLYLHLKAQYRQRNGITVPAHCLDILGCRLLFKIKPWLMVDVFLIGVLVSLIKIASLADIGMGISFWAFCAYTLGVVKCVALSDKGWLWAQLVPALPTQHVCDEHHHLAAQYTNCPMCHQINALPHRRCRRCGSRIHAYNPARHLQQSWAWLITAVIFYLPASLYPMMYTVSLGKSDGSTILGGVLLLWQLGSYPIAGVIFFASIVIPIAKMLTLAWLLITAQRQQHATSAPRLTYLRAYRITEFIGRWSMIDIFVVAILVALVQLHNLMAIYPGPAALSFAIVVLSTMISAMTFNPRLLWQPPAQPLTPSIHLNDSAHLSDSTHLSKAIKRNHDE